MTDKKNKPNIIFIFSDQHRGDTLGSLEHPVITPNLDNLAAEGVNFTKCFTNSSICMPARASMMNGQYVCEHGVWNNNAECDPKGPSHVRNIRDAGYHTAAIGRPHLYVYGEFGSNEVMMHTKDKIPTLRQWGFNDIIETSGAMATGYIDSEYSDYLKEKGLLDIYRKSMIEYNQIWARGYKPWEQKPCPLPVEDHLDSFIGRSAMKWIEDYEGDKPFYLQVLFVGPHDPFDSAEKYRKMYDPEKMPVGLLKWPNKPIPRYSRMVLSWSGLKGLTPEQNKLFRTFYYAKITLIDEWIGEIMKALKKKGIMDNTWIIYSSDHGEMLGDHFMSYKINFYEEAIRVPCIFRPPGGTAGWKCNGLTDIFDITESLIDISGAKPLKISRGRSLIKKIQGGPNDKDSQKGKEVIFSEVFGYSMVRNERYKMVVNSKSRRPVEMYDLKSDPSEINNIVRDPSFESIRQELLENLDLEKLEKI